MAEARESQVVVEALVQAPADARVSQLVLEVLLQTQCPTDFPAELAPAHDVCGTGTFPIE